MTPRGLARFGVPWAGIVVSLLAAGYAGYVMWSANRMVHDPKAEPPVSTGLLVWIFAFGVAIFIDVSRAKRRMRATGVSESGGRDLPTSTGP